MTNAAVLFLLTVLCVPINDGRDGDKATVSLQYRGVQQLDDETQHALSSLALSLLKSSNFNSARHNKILKTSVQQIQSAYRDAVKGRYLLVSFDEPHQFETAGGELTALEIVVGLNRSDYADSLFTIDAEGRVISHSKYSGSVCIELLEKVKAALSDA